MSATSFFLFLLSNFFLLFLLPRFVVMKGMFTYKPHVHVVAVRHDKRWMLVPMQLRASISRNVKHNWSPITRLFGSRNRRKGSGYFLFLEDSKLEEYALYAWMALGWKCHSAMLTPLTLCHFVSVEWSNIFDRFAELGCFVAGFFLDWGWEMGCVGNIKPYHPLRMVGQLHRWNTFVLVLCILVCNSCKCV